MRLGDPTEIIDPPLQDVNFSEVETAAKKAAAQAQDVVAQAAGNEVALLAFVFGFAGGALGTKIIKGVAGTALGIGAAWYAYNALNKGPKTLAPGQQVKQPNLTVAPPMAKPAVGDYERGC